MPKRGRPPGFLMPDSHRLKIKLANQASAVIKKLEMHLKGDKLMTTTDVNIAKLILGKVIPDLANTTVTGDANNPVLHRVIITGVRRPGDEIAGQVRVLNDGYRPLPPPDDPDH